MLVPEKNKNYTYMDYLTFPDNEKWEIIDGVPYLQAAPTWQHQAVSADLVKQFAVYFTGKQCRVFSSPFDVCLIEAKEIVSEENISTIVQPDIVIVCDSKKLRKTDTGVYHTN